MSLNVSFFTGYGQIGNYTKTQNMKRKWDNRQTNSDFGSKETKTVKYDTKSTSEKVREKILDEANKIKEAYEDFDQEFPFNCKGTDIYVKLFDILDSYISDEEVSDIRQMQLNENITRICFFSLSKFDMPAI